MASKIQLLLSFPEIELYQQLAQAHIQHIHKTGKVITIQEYIRQLLKKALR